jgi:hypothetical protein
MSVGGQRHASSALPPGKRPGTYYTGGWLGPRAGLDESGKSRSHLDSIPGPYSAKRVGILRQSVICTCHMSQIHI